MLILSKASAIKVEFAPMIQQVSALEKAASGHPYYKFNSMWSRQMQDAVCLKFNL